MKIGPPKQGVRWHPAYDIDQVRELVEKKVKRTIGMNLVKWIDIDIVSHSTGTRMQTKNLGLE